LSQGALGRFSLSAGSILIGLVLIIVLPAWAFASFLALRYAEAERQQAQTQGREIARSIAAAVDFRMRSLEAGLSTLALSKRLEVGDYRDFYQQAQAFGTAQQVTVALIDLQHNQVLNTSAPFGATLPRATDELVEFTEAAARQSTQFTKAFYGEVSRQWLSALTMPVVINGQVRYGLVAGVPVATRWGEVLDTFDLPSGWIVSISDEVRTIVARRPNPQSYIGRPVHPDALAVVASGADGWGIGRSRDGAPVYVAFAHLARPDWLVLVGVPSDDVDGAVMRALWPVIQGGLSILTISLLLAWMLGRRFSHQIGDLARTAVAFRGGEAVAATAAGTGIREVDELRETLSQASRERSRYEDELRALLTEKDLLMQEVHHRVKNSLQLVRGILSLQARGAVHDEAKSALQAAAARILTVADVHQHLYQGASIAEVNVRQYLQELAQDLARSMLDGEIGRSIHIDAPDTYWSSEKVMPLGLITTELVTNAIKYGAGDVAVLLAEDEDGGFMLRVDDQGAGFPDGHEIGQGGGLGSRLITSLVRPQDGRVWIDRSVAHGRVVVECRAHWQRRDQV
jgi:two-component sensor histidine kinase